jgi:TPR repeat protein
MAEDPAELWKRVQRGSTDAEIELARLYLDGTRVAQNCEQAHLLLLAAAKKHSGKAGDLLTGVYSQRCQ